MKFIISILLLSISVVGISQPIVITPGSGTAGGVTAQQVRDSMTVIRSLIDSASSAAAVTVNRKIQRLNITNPFNAAYTKYNGWFGTYDYGNTHAIIVREGDIHTYDGTSPVYMVRYATTNGGYDWVKDTLYYEEDFDIRAYECGVNPATGRIFIFYTRYKGPDNGGFISNRVMYSDDGGDTWTHSADLNLNGVTHEFSSFGIVQVCENGDLLASFYGDIGNYITDPSTTVPKVYTLRSSDNGATWGSPVTIKQGLPGESLLYNETCLIHLGNGRWIAVMRKELGLNKQCLVYNSDDDALTWDSIGIATWGSASEVAGVSPMIFKKNDSTAYLLSTWRASENAFGVNEIEFGSAAATTPQRIFYQANNELAFGINFGYPVPLFFSENEEDWLLAFYDTSTRLDGVDEGTDVVVIPFTLQRYTNIRTIPNHNVPPNTDAYIIAQGVKVDELAATTRGADRSYWLIPLDAVYNIQFSHTFTTTNATGTFRRVVFERWNEIDNIMTGELYSETHYVANTGYEVFQFNFSADLKAGECVRAYFRHDATGNVVTGATAPSIRITQVKQ